MFTFYEMYSEHCPPPDVTLIFEGTEHAQNQFMPQYFEACLEFMCSRL